MKKIAVIVRNLPLNTRRNAEALRMSVGLTLVGDKVTVIFMEDGVYTATHIKPEVLNFAPLDKEFGAFSMLKCTLLADKPSMEKRGISELIANVKPTEREELVNTITESDIVIPF
ncbi:MAG: DsrE family protein [Candidatus Methanoperedens sp.]|nr:DsrE family protein [Candidatus Methanoperedens sp.]